MKLGWWGIVTAGIVIVIVAFVTRSQAANQGTSEDGPEYISGGSELVRPANYREWIYLSSGLGMNYSPAAGGEERFTNVFVAPWAYRQFMESGKWPDKTMFVVEERRSASKGSINRAGRYQTDCVGMGVEVKDEKRFPEKWAYFSFAPQVRSAKPNPKGACRQCHHDHAAVENTFVQFYPTLKPIAEKFGTYHPTK